MEPNIETLPYHELLAYRDEVRRNIENDWAPYHDRQGSAKFQNDPDSMWRAYGLLMKLDRLIAKHQHNSRNRLEGAV